MVAPEKPGEEDEVRIRRGGRIVGASECGEVRRPEAGMRVAAAVMLALSIGVAIAQAPSRPDAGFEPVAETIRQHLRPAPLRFVEAARDGPGIGTFVVRRGEGRVVLDQHRWQLQRSVAARSGKPVGLCWLGANTLSRPAGEEPTDSRTDYFLGNDPARWRAGVRAFGRVRYPELYRGIDLVCYPQDQNLEYDFQLSPGANPAAIRMKLEGIRNVRIDVGGDLIGMAEGGEVRQQRPRIYQEIDGQRRDVPGRFVLVSAEPEVTFGFEVGPYDRSRELVIDPVLELSSYFGGSQHDAATAVAVSADGNRIYMAGETYSADFPTANPLQTPAPGQKDIFVTVLAARTGRVMYSAWIGGTGDDTATGIATNRSGQIYLTGTTASKDFPPVGHLQRENKGLRDAVLLKLDPNQSGASALVFSSYLGDAGEDSGGAVAVLDGAGDQVCVCGTTTGPDFFTTMGARQRVHAGGTDAFITLFKGLSSRKIQNVEIGYSTLLGGPGYDRGVALATGEASKVYITGVAGSGFPTTANACQPVFGGGNSDAYAAELMIPASGDPTLPYVTYLGGSTDEAARGIAVDANERLYVTGWTESSNFPIKRALPSYPPTAGRDGFVSQLDRSAAGAAGLLFSMRLGGEDKDEGHAVQVRQLGHNAAPTLFVAGDTSSTDMPVVNGLQSHGGTGDIFVTSIEVPDEHNPSLTFSTYLGGSGDDAVPGMALEPRGAIVVVGRTESKADASTGKGGFPLADPLQAYLRGDEDAFFARIVPGGAGRLVVSPLRVPFGSLRLNATRTRTRPVRVYNAGRGTLTLSVGIPAGPFKVAPAITSAPLYLAPRERRTIPVEFAPLSSGAFESTLTLTGNAPRSRPVQVRLSGSAE